MCCLCLVVAVIGAQLLLQVEAVQPVFEAPQPAQGTLFWPTTTTTSTTSTSTTSTSRDQQRRLFPVHVHREGVDDLHSVDDAHAGHPLAVVAAQEVGQGHQVLPVQAHLSPRILCQVDLRRVSDETG